MGAPQFTPGPWECSPTDDEMHAVVSPPTDAGDEIGPWFTAIISCTDDAVENANANLIAAAPELLERLEDFCGIVKDDALLAMDADLADAVAAANAVIAKARGEQ